MLSYYGSKSNIAARYPGPVKGLPLIEPFCGFAHYALEHFENDVYLYDKWPVIIDIWKWLQSCSQNDILSLPKTMRPGESVDNIKFDCEAQRNFYGFIIGAGQQYPVRTAGARRTTHRPNAIKYCLTNCANQLYKIQHWKISCSHYLDITDQDKTATWFIDPPYQFGGHKYAMSSLKIDFTQLATWCKLRSGKVIVCENTKADWLPFVPMLTQRGSNGTATEAIYTNFPTHFHNLQSALF